MKKDLYLLTAIAVAFAIALTVAAWRGVLPPLAVWNPLAGWPARKCSIALAAALLAFIAGIVAIGWSDRGLVHPSPTLEWVYSPDQAQRIVNDYCSHQPDDQRGQALRGLLLDSVLFIPAYVLLIAVLSFWTAKLHCHSPWGGWLVAFGWLAFLAGAFDYLENAGIYAALGGVSTRVAPVTYLACQLKWLIALTGFWFAIFSGLMAHLRR